LEHVLFRKLAARLILRDVVRTAHDAACYKEVETKGPRHVWCTFSHDSDHLDFRNPSAAGVFCGSFACMWTMACRSSAGSVAFLLESNRDPSIHLPQTHAIIRLMRLLCDYAPESHFC